MNKVTTIAERMVGTALLLGAATFSFLVMSGLFVPSAEWGVFADAKKAQIVFQVSLWALAFQAFDWYSPGRTLWAILRCDGPLASSEDKKAAAILYGAVAIALALLISGSAFP